MATKVSTGGTFSQLISHSSSVIKKMTEIESSMMKKEEELFGKSEANTEGVTKPLNGSCEILHYDLSTIEDFLQYLDNFLTRL